MKNALLFLVTFASAAFSQAGTQQARDPCLDNVKRAAEYIGMLNDLSPNPEKTLIEKIESNNKVNYLVMTENTMGSRTGAFTVRLGELGFCRIATVIDEDAQ